MITGIRAGVVFLYVQAPISYATDGTPIQPTEMDNEVWRYISNVLVNFFRLEDQRIQRAALIVGETFEARLHFVLKSIVFGRENDALRLPPDYVEENTR